MSDLRQSPSWAYYISQINWRVKRVGKNQLFIREIPLLKKTFIKMQRPDNPVDLKKVDQIAQEEKSLFVLLEPTIDGHSETKLRENHYQKAPKMSLTHTATIQIDLTKSLDHIFKGFSENARRNIRKAQKNNLSIGVELLSQPSAEKHFEEFYRLFSNLTKIKKFWAPSYDEYHKKMIGFKDNSYLLFAYLDNKPVAAVWLGIFDNKSWYMNTGITDEGYKLLANYLLVWEAIKFSKKLKLRTFDFEGIFDPRFPFDRKTWKGFSEFKKRFHGKVVEYPPPYIKIYSKAFKIFYLCTNRFYN